MKINRIALFTIGLSLLASTCFRCGAAVEPDDLSVDDESESFQIHGIQVPQAEQKPENTAYCALPDFLLIDFESEETGMKITGKLVRAGSKTVGVQVNGKLINLEIADLTEDSKKLVRRFQVRGIVKPLPLDDVQMDRLDEKRLESYSYIRSPGKKVDFLLYTPKIAKSPGREIPLILYLHGMGGSGTDNLKTLKDGHGAVLHLLGENFQKFMPCYVLIPQSHNVENAWRSWATVGGERPLAQAVHAIDTLKADIAPDIDMRRLYLTGLSSGGMGCFDALSLFPGKFAAAVSVSGDVGYEQIGPWNVRPVWMVFNKNDTQMCLQNVEDLKKRFTALRGELKVTELPGHNHDAWSATYSNPDFRKWLQRQKLNLIYYPSDWSDPVK